MSQMFELWTFYMLQSFNVERRCIKPHGDPGSLDSTDNNEDFTWIAVQTVAEQSRAEGSRVGWFWVSCWTTACISDFRIMADTCS